MICMKQKKVTDTQLVEKVRQGSMEAFEEIISRYESKVYNLAMRFCRNQEDAEEVLQDVFSTIYSKLDGFRGQSQFSSWMYRIIVNAAFMKLRKRKQSHTISLEDLAPQVRQSCLEQDNPVLHRSDTITQNNELRKTLDAAIGRLPSQYRAVFILRDVDGLSNQEVSEILGLSIPAVKSRLHRSRLMLRRRLQRYYLEFAGRKELPPEIREEANQSL
jgi:RNA polymerase sigma-70 factor (ECF subfamily)